MPTLEDLYPSGDTPRKPAQRPVTGKKSLDELYPQSAGGFDLNRLDELEKEFGLTTPKEVAYEPLATPWDYLSRAPKFITDPAKRFAERMTRPVADRGMIESYARGALGGAAEGVAELFSPLNVVSTVAGLGAEKAALAQLPKLAGLLRGANVASAAPLVAHGGYGVMEDPTNAAAWAELAGGAAGAYFGGKSGKVVGGKPGAGGRTPEPLTPPSRPPDRFPPPGEAPTGGTPWRPGGRPGMPLRDAVDMSSVQSKLDELYPPETTPARFPNELGVSSGGTWRSTGGRAGMPLREPLTLQDLLGGPDSLLPPDAPVSRFPEPGAPSTGAPWRGGGVAGRPGQTAGLRESLTLEELLAPPKPAPMRAGGLDVEPPSNVVYPRFPRKGIEEAQQAMERGEGAPSDLAAFFGLEQPRQPIGTGLSDVGQMDLGARPVLGSDLGDPFGPGRAAPIRPGGLAPVDAPTGPGPLAPGRVPTPAEALRPRMPNAATIQAAQAYIDGTGPKPAGFDELARFFGLDVPAAPPAPPRPVMQRQPLPRGPVAPPPVMEGPALPPKPIAQAPAVPSMTVENLKNLLSRRLSGEMVPELDEVAKLSGKQLPADIRQSVTNVLDDMESRPFMKGESWDDLGEGGGFATGQDRIRESATSGGVVFENNPDFPNLVRHYPGAPVFNDIMQGAAGTRASAIDALRRVLEGGRQTSLTNRARSVAELDLLARGPGDITDVTGRSLMPGRANVQGAPEGPFPPELPEIGGVGQIDVLPTGEGQPRLPGDVGGVRDLEVPQPRVAPVPEQSFDLTAPPETQPNQGGLLAESAQTPGGLRPESAPTPGRVHPKTQELWDFLNDAKLKEEAKLAAEGNPLAETGGLAETPAELQARILAEPDPRTLWGKERKLRKLLEGEGGGEAGFVGEGNDFGTSLTVPLTGAITGGLSGAAYDDENRVRGALLGTLAGGLGGRALARFVNSPAMPTVARAADDLLPVSRKYGQPKGANSTGMTLKLKPETDTPELQWLDEGSFRNNASGESAASMEALSRQSGMKARGEQFVVYDRAGTKRPLIGPDAVDYTVRPGETYGVEGPSGFRKLDDKGGRFPGKKYGDSGFIDTGALSSGAASDALSDIGKKVEQGAYFSMLSGPSTLIKGHVGAGSAVLSRAVEETLAGRPEVGANIVRNLFSQRSRDAYMRALREGSPDPTDVGRWGDTQGFLGTPSRIMSAPDAFVTEAMIDAGIPLESAKRSAFTSKDPRSAIGQFIVNTQRGMPSAIRPIALPFARTATNITERGIERTPGLGLLFEAMQKDSTPWRDVAARQITGAGAMGAGYGLAGEEGEMPNPYAMAASGPYAVPLALGAAIRKMTEAGPVRTGTTSASTRALRDATQAVMSQGPLPTEGYELDRLMDPRMWPTRWIPRAVSSFADAGAYAQPGILDPMIARIPWLNEMLLSPRRKSDAQRRR